MISTTPTAIVGHGLDRLGAGTSNSSWYGSSARSIRCSGAVPGASDRPQLSQTRAPSTFSVRQFGQTSTSVLPDHGLLGQCEPGVERLHRGLDGLGPDDASGADRRGRDHLDVDTRFSQRGEHVGLDAGMRLHPRTDERYRGDPVVRGEPLGSDLSGNAVDHRGGVRKVCLRHRERHVGEAVLRHVLDDGVHADAFIGHGPEDGRGDTGAIGHALYRDLGLAGVVDDPGDDGLLHALMGLADPARPDVGDAGPAMTGIGDDPGLGAGVAGGGKPGRVDGDRQEGHGDPLAGSQEEVQLPRVRHGGEPLRHRGPVIGGIAHRRDDNDDLVAVLAGPDDALAHGPDPGDVRDRGSSVLLDDDRHHISRRPSRAWPSVTSSAYSRSPPTGRPLASRVTRTPRGLSRPATYIAVALPSRFGFVARITSPTPLRPTRSSSSWTRRSSGPIPCIGEMAPPRTWYRPLIAPVRSSAETSFGSSTTHTTVVSRVGSAQNLHNSPSDTP